MAEKEVEQHVVSQLDIRYTMPTGVVNMLAAMSGKTTPEIWCEISDMANICAFRLSTKSQRSSWTQKVFPGTQVELRIDMDKSEPWWHDPKKPKPPTYYEARVKISGRTTEDYITETILLGD